MNRLKFYDLLPNMFAGAISGLVTLIYSISYAALVFSGDLAEYLPLGISCALISGTINAFWVALNSSLPFTIAGPDSNASAILSLMAAAIATSMISSSNTTDLVFPTVWLAIALSTVITGLCLFTLGRLRLGSFIRFIPYPVIGGFLAGVGWLLTQGSFTVMTGKSLDMTHLPALFDSSLLLHWLPGVFLAFTLQVILRRYKNPVLLPGITLLAIAGFYLLLRVVGISTDQARSQGLLFEALSSGGLWHPSNVMALMQVNLSFIGDQLGSLMTLIAVVAITILLCASGIELATQTDVDLDKELRTAGVANIMTGLLGGMAGYLSISRSLLNYKAGATNRFAGVFAATLCATFLIFGVSFLAYLPKVIFGGLLLYVGLSLLIEWVYQSWFDLSRLDYILVIIILLIVANFGFLEGVGFGVIIACLLFVLNYSKLRVIKNALSGVSFHSNFERSFHQKRLLREKGEELYILRLQGYIFFGTANTLLEHVRSRINNATLPKISFLVIDFQLTGGLDSSSVISFIKMRRLAKQSGITLVLTDLSADIAGKLLQSHVIDAVGDEEKPDAVTRTFPDLDHGVEWCENQILRRGTFRRKRFVPLAMQLEEVFPLPNKTTKFLNRLEKLKVQPGYCLYRQGDLSEAIYFVESGQISILQKLDNGEEVRVGTASEGTVIGEVGFYKGSVHPVSAIADESCSLYRLSREALTQLEQEEPQLASACHQFIAKLLAERVAQADERSRVLLE
ncbi:SLC26A/SulP transporter family protein [Oscillatoria sp. FACHB-1407]|uniref:SulP family inorganic anion transporter n=1 Tax=Oscillatoria sp. FACHB-1407 TaxID=2692847 RepID=UPI00168819AC|nr:SulP family inorganic anion transporter [Oscillatoria sp. FACHB-1407]MBD2460431.1 SLC26A/SulP transporter family protein [Oscillatoria sp. FACHB-1407]